jgi:hypothetical protein
MLKGHVRSSTVSAYPLRKTEEFSYKTFFMLAVKFIC